MHTSNEAEFMLSLKASFRVHYKQFHTKIRKVEGCLQQKHAMDTNTKQDKSAFKLNFRSFGN